MQILHRSISKLVPYRLSCARMTTQLSGWWLRSTNSGSRSRIGQFGQLSPHTTRIDIYRDATGQRRHSSSSRTDWELVREFFRRLPYQRKFHIPSSNPRLKDRVNCVNAMLHNQAGDRRLSIAPGCKDLILDLERVHWRNDSNGNTITDIDKGDSLRSHVSDALGYMIAQEFGRRGHFGDMPGLLQ